MAYRCEDCSKFCGVDLEVESADVEWDGESIHVAVELILSSQCCGSEVARATAEDTFGLEEELEHDKEGCEGDWEAEETSSEVSDRYEDKDRHGKKIKSFRYMKHFYGADVNFTVRCHDCGASADGSRYVEAQASEFEGAW